MPKRQISFQAGEYYHLYNRSVGRQLLFRDPENYHYLIQLAEKYSERLQISVIAYCLMPNHYHFLVRQDGKHPVGLFPQRIFNAYVKAFNKKYRRKGTLFEGRYKAVHVGETVYLYHLCRYIHCNPVKAGVVDDAAEWPYSNYGDWLFPRQSVLTDREFITQHFSDPGEYQEFAQDYLEDSAGLPLEIEKYLFD